MKKLSSLLAFSIILALAACGGRETQEESKPQIQLQNNNRTSEKPKTEEKATTADAEADAMNNKGIGPIENLELAEIDQALVAQGEELFNKNCTACHKVDKRYIGPAVAGVMDRRTPEWVMNMMLNPTEMIQKDPLAKQLVGEFNGAVMANQNLTEEEARAILEYFRTLNN